MKILKLLLSHLTVILSLILIVLLIVDHLNPTMDFLDNSAAKVFLLLLCLASLILGIIALIPSKRK